MTDRQTDRQTGRQAGRQAQTDMWDGQTGLQAGFLVQTGIHADRQGSNYRGVLTPLIKTWTPPKTTGWGGSIHLYISILPVIVNVLEKKLTPPIVFV